MKKYVTTDNDTWDFISYKLYGNEYYIKILMLANTDKINYRIFPSGINLIIPDLVVTEESEKTAWEV